MKKGDVGMETLDQEQAKRTRIVVVVGNALIIVMLLSLFWCLRGMLMGTYVSQHEPSEDRVEEDGYGVKLKTVFSTGNLVGSKLAVLTFETEKEVLHVETEVEVTRPMRGVEIETRMCGNAKIVAGTMKLDGEPVEGIVTVGIPLWGAWRTVTPIEVKLTEPGERAKLEFDVEFTTEKEGVIKIMQAVDSEGRNGVLASTQVECTVIKHGDQVWLAITIIAVFVTLLICNVGCRRRRRTGIE